MSNELQINQKANNLKALLEKAKTEIAAALPSHLTPQRMTRIAFTEARKIPKLLECEPLSFIGAVIQASQLGLEPGSALGQCWLIPYYNGQTKKMEVQFQIGYKGMLSLISRSPDAPRVMPRAVYEGDDFNFEYGMTEHLTHKPNEKSDKLTHVYCVARFKDGSSAFMVMTAKEIEKVRGRSKASNSGPWSTDYEAMALKSVIRKMFKYLPSSVEMQNAISLDEAGERGEQDNASVIETTGMQIDNQQSKTEAFKEALNQPEQEQGGFANFVAPTTKHKLEEKEPEPEAAEETPSDLVMQVMDAATAAGLDIQKLTERCKKDFKKTPRELETKELVKLLSALKKAGTMEKFEGNLK